MKTLWHFVLLSIITILAIVLGVILGERGAWYFSWLIGTVMLVLFAAAGGVLYDTQQLEADAQDR